MCLKPTSKPAWRSQKCTRCGNDRHFVVFTVWQRHQALLVDAGELYWGPAEDSTDRTSSTMVLCAACEERSGGISVVWPPDEGSGPACAATPLPPTPDEESATDKSKTPQSAPSSDAKTDG